MSDEPNSLILRYLRRIDKRMDTHLSKLVGRTGLLAQSYASVCHRLDQIDFRMERIERRLDLIGGHSA